MPYTKDPPPVGSDESTKVAYLDRELVKIQQETGVLRDLIRVALQYIAVNGIKLEYLWDDTSTGVVASGRLGVDSNQLTGVTEIRASFLDVYGRDLRDLLPQRGYSRPGDFMVLADPDRSLSAVYQVTALVVQEAAQFVIPVAYVEGGGNPGVDDTVSLTWTPSLDAIQGSEPRYRI